MAVSMSCKGCGKTLFTGREVIEPYYIRAKNNSRCPSCGRNLAKTPMSIQLDLLTIAH
ncbi:MAG: hypothetical protein NWF03_01725 [Candidatus Bathyarchaeota archaeon]|nr:hypothetical protein [Candidatus Bathyarchaeota archaeon]